MENDNVLTLPLEIQEEAMIKVMGVGGGGGNAVNYLYRQGIEGVSFLICNTDQQALKKSPIPAKLQLGPGLGAGGKPEVAEKYAEENRKAIHDALNDDTKMLFITAGMGGGTGTGASSIVAQVAQELGILTIGIVTIPFEFEGQPKILKALKGIACLAEHVDALLIINNQKLIQLYPELTVLDAFKKADDVVANAARAIAEIITIPSEYINTDFADVYNTMKDGKVAMMNTGRASGEDRITKAIQNALESPLVNTSDVYGAKRILLQLYCSHDHAITTIEFDQIHRFVEKVGETVEVQWGLSIDDELGEDVRITIIATGYEVSDIPTLTDLDKDETLSAIINTYYQPKEEEPQNEPSDTPQTTEPENDNSEEEVIDLTNGNNRQSSIPQPTHSHNNIEIEFTSEEDNEYTPSEDKSPKHNWFRSRLNR